MADELHIYEDISDYKYCVSEKINVKKLKKSVKYIQRIDKKAKREAKKYPTLYSKHPWIPKSESSDFLWSFEHFTNAKVLHTIFKKNQC